MQAAGANLPLPDLCIDRAMREARGPMGAFGDPASGLGAGDEPADSGAHLLICSVTPSRSAGALQRRLAFELFKSCDSRRNTNFNWSICSSRSGAHFDSGLPIGDLRGEWCREGCAADLPHPQLDAGRFDRSANSRGARDRLCGIRRRGQRCTARLPQPRFARPQSVAARRTLQPQQVSRPAGAKGTAVRDRRYVVRQCTRREAAPDT